jgi:hypothetical protein
MKCVVLIIIMINTRQLKKRKWNTLSHINNNISVYKWENIISKRQWIDVFYKGCRINYGKSVGITVPTNLAIYKDLFIFLL